MCAQPVTSAFPVASRTSEGLEGTKGAITAQIINTILRRALQSPGLDKLRIVPIWRVVEHLSLQCGALTICHQAVPVKVKRDCKTVSMPIIHCSSTRLCCRPISPRHGTRTLITTLGAPTYRSKMAGEIVTSAGYPMFGTLMVTNYIYIYIICKLIYIYMYFAWYTIGFTSIGFLSLLRS